MQPLPGLPSSLPACLPACHWNPERGWLQPLARWSFGSQGVLVGDGVRRVAGANDGRKTGAGGGWVGYVRAPTESSSLCSSVCYMALREHHPPPPSPPSRLVEWETGLELRNENRERKRITDSPSPTPTDLSSHTLLYRVLSGVLLSCHVIVARGRAREKFRGRRAALIIRSFSSAKIFRPLFSLHVYQASFTFTHATKGQYYCWNYF